MEAMWKGLDTSEQKTIQFDLNCCGFDAVFVEDEDIVKPECPVDQTNTTVTEFCYPALEENISGTVQLMAVLQLICSLLILPLGVKVFIVWQDHRSKSKALELYADQDKYIDLLGKPPLDPPKIKELDKKKIEELKKVEAAKKKEAELRTYWEGFKYNAYNIWVELRENHHILEIYLSTQVDFPRRDRALVFLSYTLMMFVTSALAYGVDFNTPSCCSDDEDYGPLIEIDAEIVTQSCAWWKNTTIAQNVTTGMCADNSFAADFSEKDVTNLLDSCPSSCGGCDEVSRLAVSCRVAIVLINFLIALPPTLVLGVTFTNVYKLDRLNDSRWDTVMPNIVDIRTQVKALRSHYRRFMQLGTWDNADLIVDTLICVEDWSKAATMSLLSSSNSDERETSLMWLSYTRNHLDQLVGAIEKGHLNAAAEQMKLLISFDPHEVEDSVTSATSAFLTGGGALSKGAMGKLKSKSNEAKKAALQTELTGSSIVLPPPVDTTANPEEGKDKKSPGGFASNLMKKGKVYITGESDDEKSPGGGRPKTPLNKLFGKKAKNPEQTNWSTLQEKESAEALEKIKAYFEEGLGQRIRRKMRAKWGLRFVYATLILYILACTWYVMLFALNTGQEDNGVSKTNDWLLLTLETWTLTFLVIEPSTIAAKAMLLAVLLKKFQGTRCGTVVGTWVEMGAAFMTGDLDNIGNNGGDILAAGGAGETDENKPRKSNDLKGSTSRDAANIVAAVFSGHKDQLTDGKKKEKKPAAGLSLLSGKKKYQVHVGPDDDEDGKEEEKTDEPAMHFDPKAEAQVMTLTPRRDPAEEKTTSPLVETKPKGPPANMFGAGAVDAVTGAAAPPAGSSTLQQIQQLPASNIRGSKLLSGPPSSPPVESKEAKAKGPPASVLQTSDASTKSPPSRGPPANLMASAAQGKTKGPPAGLMQAKGPPAGLMKMSGGAGAKSSSSTAAPKVKGPSVNLMKSAMAKKQASPDSASKEKDFK